MRVLSCFDGIGGARIALDKLNISVSHYYAVEIDSKAIKAHKQNYPKSTHLGSILDLSDSTLENLKPIDLLTGGSPCQNFSFAGKKNGASTVENIEVTSYAQYEVLKRSGFKFEGQSYLFWEFIRVLKILKPKYFLFENVVPEKKWISVFEENLAGVSKIINSNRVVPQNRERLYITNITLPLKLPDLYPKLKDIINLNEVEKPDGVFKKYVNPKGDNVKIVGELNIDTKFNEAKVVFDWDGCGKTLTTYHGHEVRVALKDTSFYHNLTKEELERYQGVPVGYLKDFKYYEAFTLLGNGWTIPIIMWLMSDLRSKYETK